MRHHRIESRGAQDGGGDSFMDQTDVEMGMLTNVRGGTRKGLSEGGGRGLGADRGSGCYSRGL